jgi:excisionase family DNA binding protein
VEPFNPVSLDAETVEPQNVASRKGNEMAVARRHLDSKDAANYLGFGEGAKGAAQIRQLVHRGEIPHHKVGARLRFDIKALDAWMAQKHVKA